MPSHDQRVEWVSLKIYILVKLFPAEYILVSKQSLGRAQHSECNALLLLGIFES